MDACRFHILVIYTVITDERISHGDNLAFIGGVGNHFLITGHARVEYDFAHSFAVAGKCGALKHCRLPKPTKLFVFDSTAAFIFYLPTKRHMAAFSDQSNCSQREREQTTGYPPS